MEPVIDVPQNVANFAQKIAARGIHTVIRYYNRQNSNSLPTKRLEKSEAEGLVDAGLALAVVFQQRGGAGGHIEDLDRESGKKDAARAVELAEKLEQPKGSAIYFAVDHDYFRASEIAAITPYFEEARKALGDRWRVGCYSSGKVGRAMRNAGLVDLIWVAGATGWSGTKDILQTDEWALFQQSLHKTWDGGAFGFDGNVVGAAFPDYGQFTIGNGAARVVARGFADRPLPTPSPVPATTLMEISARSGLRLRGGPGTEFATITSLPLGAIVHAIGKIDGWIKVDLEGDGQADGFMSGEFLKPLSGGFPLAIAPPVGSTLRPIDVARGEMGVSEIAGSAHNPRIILYHSTTTLAAEKDEVPWCSSFVNFCVEQSGRIGTDSARAMSWHEEAWGNDVSAHPKEGDIAVFRRRAGGPSGEVKGGHVGFWLSDQGDRIELLGGNQSNKVKISHYPKDGTFTNGTNHYELLSVRRP
ncbi:MAG: TIGR02594 family protein [Pseudomonadota bacterium]